MLHSSSFTKLVLLDFGVILTELCCLHFAKMFSVDTRELAIDGNITPGETTVLAFICQSGPPAPECSSDEILCETELVFPSAHESSKTLST